MTIKISDVLKKVRYELRDTDETKYEWPDEELMIYINECWAMLYDKILNQYPALLEKRMQIIIPAGVDVIYLLLNILRILSLSTLDGKYLTAVREVPVGGDPVRTGPPELYSMSGPSMLRVFPRPVEDTGVTLVYIEDLEELSPESELELPFRFSHYLKEYCLLRAYNRAEAKPEIEATFWQAHGRSLNTLLENFTPALLTGRGPWVV